MHSASNLKLTQSGKTECTLPELKAYLGTEILASVLGIKRLSHMWSTNLYIGNPGIRRTIYRNRFDEILQTVVTYVDHDYRSKSADPLWTLRSIMQMFLVQSTTLAVPIGVLTLDEATMPYNGRNGARCYIPNNPDPYGIRFYMVIESKYQHIFTMFDNGHANKGVNTISECYCEQFPVLHSSLHKLTNGNYNVIDVTTATYLWCLMLAHTTTVKSMNSFSGTGRNNRYLYVDNFYTCPVFAKKLKNMTGGEIVTTGTMRLNYLDALNKAAVTHSVKNLELKAQGSWELLAVKESYVDPSGKTKTRKMPNSGFIVLKDKKTVVFFTNDLTDTPKKFSSRGNDPEAIALVRGLGPIKRFDKK